MHFHYDRLIGQMEADAAMASAAGSGSDAPIAEMPAPAQEPARAAAG
jgi:hypothetical protein